jgi:CubicO group peptidase (beta-lactamase class C family)
MDALGQIDAWPGGRSAVALLSPAGLVASHGERELPFAWASVTKLATAVCVLVAVEEGLFGLADDAGPHGSSVRHLLAHASGLPLEGDAPIAAPGVRRIYSNSGFELLGAHVAAAAEMPFAAYFEAVWGFALAGSPAHGVSAPLAELERVALELLSPTRLSAHMLAEAARVQFPGLTGVLPGFGRQEPNDWGLGFELRDAKHPHWTGARNAPATFGVAGLALAGLSAEPFGPWAQEAWPRLSDAVLAAPQLPAAGRWPFGG